MGLARPITPMLLDPQLYKNMLSTELLDTRLFRLEPSRSRPVTSTSSPTRRLSPSPPPAMLPASPRPLLRPVPSLPQLSLLLPPMLLPSPPHLSTLDPPPLTPSPSRR